MPRPKFPHTALQVGYVYLYHGESLTGHACVLRRALHPQHPSCTPSPPPLVSTPCTEHACRPALALPAHSAQLSLHPPPASSHRAFNKAPPWPSPRAAPRHPPRPSFLPAPLRLRLPPLHLGLRLGFHRSVAPRAIRPPCHTHSPRRLMGSRAVSFSGSVTRRRPIAARSVKHATAAAANQRAAPRWHEQNTVENQATVVPVNSQIATVQKQQKRRRCSNAAAAFVFVVVTIGLSTCIAPYPRTRSSALRVATSRVRGRGRGAAVPACWRLIG